MLDFPSAAVSAVAVAHAMPTTQSFMDMVRSILCQRPEIAELRFHYQAPGLDDAQSALIEDDNDYDFVYPLKAEGWVFGIMCVSFTEARENDHNAILTLATLICSHLLERERARVLECLVEERTQELQDLLAKSEEMVARKSNALANISHELRTPLNAIVGFSEVMSAGTFGPIGNDKYKDYVDLIHSAATHLSSLTERLLEYSRYSMTVDVGTFEPVNMCDAVETVVRYFQQENPAVEPRLINKFHGPCTVRGDAMALKQSIINLVSNALKYGPREGHVVIQQASNDPALCCVEVVDEGAGFDQAHEERLLRAFERDHQTRERVEGLGLGLPLVREICETHNGALTFKWHQPRGFSAMITLPLNATEMPPQGGEA